VIAEHPGLWTCSGTEYHAETEHVSSSSLSVFIQSRPLYHGQYVTGKIPRPEPTEAMQFGSALHARLLEPDTWQDQVAIAPEVNRRTNAGKAEWQNFLDGANGRIVIDQEQAETLERVVEGVYRNPFARDLLTAQGQNELSFRWELDGVPVKCRWDRLLDAGLIADLKTTTDPSEREFGRSCFNFGYYRQAWLYRAGAIELGIGAPEFLHLACGTEPPYECHVYELDERALDLGEREVRAALRDLAECRATGNWSSPLSGRINTLSLPRFAFTQ
jgi:PDDEXK-like domain of unknown function (DUF3799)